MRISGLDHIVLTVRDVDATAHFYEAIGFARVDQDGRTSLRAGVLRINLHPYPSAIEPRAAHPTVGSADFCIVTVNRVEDTVATLIASGIPIALGPIARTGASGEMDSVYVRDPDNNLLELASYQR